MRADSYSGQPFLQSLRRAGRRWQSTATARTSRRRPIGAAGNGRLCPGSNGRRAGHLYGQADVVMVWYAVATLIVLAICALAGLLNSYWPQWVTGWVAFFVILGIGLLVFAIPVYKHILRRREVYTLTNHKLEIRYGLIAKTVQNIPLRNIQEVTVKASVRQRLLKLGDVVVESASEMGTTKLSEIHNPDRYAGMILAELRRRN
jgi:membrane protein YdbS with pleckstrin-like domain